MSDYKKYYWLKLQKDFFKRADIRVVEAMPNGKDYILFYLKLLVESVSHDGELRFSDTIPYSEDMLSVITNTNIDVVRSAMRIFKELKMVEVLEDATIYMNEVEKMIGSESSWAIEKRRQREKRAESGQCPPKSRHCPKMSTQCPPEIEKEKELDINNIYIVEQSTTPYTEIIDYLNKKAGTKFKLTTRKTRALIGARTKDGFSLDDFKTVIDKKCDEWKGTEFEKFLRPETLFGTKFEGYLNAKEKRSYVAVSEADDLDDIF